MPKYRFATVRNSFPDGCYVKIDGEAEVDMRIFAKEAREGKHRNVVLVRPHFATGNGLSIGLATEEEFFNRRGGGYFLPARTTRGGRGATDEELAAVPKYVRAAYEWWHSR